MRAMVSNPDEARITTVRRHAVNVRLCVHTLLLTFSVRDCQFEPNVCTPNRYYAATVGSRDSP